MLSEEKLRTLLVERGLLTPQQLGDCLGEQAKDSQAGMTHRMLIQIAVDKGYLTQAQAQDLMDGRVTASARQAALPEEVEKAQADPANLVGKYIRLQQLGRGGMGVVYRAWDRDLRRVVALKFLEVVSDQDIRRFQREAQLAAGLKHKNIAQVHEMGTWQGRHFLAMEFVNGTNLDKYIGKVNERQIAGIMLQVCDAIDYAHSKGIIHRDIKPQNIMIERQPAGSKALQVYVMDFGLARPMQVDTSLSTSGVVMGTPQYMSPEQAMGNPNELDAHTDIYSIGSTMYHLYTGQPSVVGATPIQVVMNLHSQDPIPLHKVRPTVNKDFETIVHKCLERDKARRYPAAAALRDDLQNFIADLPIQAHGPSVMYTLQKKAKRHRAAIIAAVCLVAGLVAAVGVLIASGKKIKETQKTTEAEMKERRTRAAQLSSDARDAVERARKAKSKSARQSRTQDLTRAVEMMTEAIRLVGDDSAIFMTRAEAHGMLGKAGPAVADYSKALSLKPDLGEALYRRIVLQFLQIGEGFDLTLGMDVGSPNLTVTPFSRKFDRASVAADLEKLRALGTAFTAKVKCVEGVLCFYDAKYSDAHAKFSAAVEEESFADAFAFRGYTGLLMFQQKKGPESAEQHRNVLQDMTTAINLESNVPIYYIIRALAHASDNDLGKAVDDVDDSLEITPNEGDLHALRSYLLFLNGETKEAEAALARARELEPTNPRIDMIASYMQWSAGDSKAAIKTLDAAAAREPDYPSLFYLRGLYKLLLKDKAGSDQDFQKYLGMLPKEQQGSAAEFVNKMKGLAGIFGNFGQLKSPKEMFQDATKAQADGKSDEASILYRAILNRLRGALGREKKAPGLTPQEADTLVKDSSFNLLKIHVQKRELLKAVGVFDQMVRGGFNDWDRLKNDPTLKEFYNSPKVQEIIKKHPK